MRIGEVNQTLQAIPNKKSNNGTRKVRYALLFRAMEISDTTPDPKPNSRGLISPINRRDLIRAALAAGMTSALGPAFSFAQAISSGLTPAALGQDGSKFLTDPNWKLVYLSDHQNETLIALSDVIIPATDSPGAKEALVNRYLDLLLSVQPATFQQRFVDGLAFVDSESQKLFGEDFVALSADDQISLLTAWAYPEQPDWWIEQENTSDPGQKHFAHLKGMIADAYYGSEIGAKELGWDGEITHGPYQGCEHSDGTHT